MEGIRARGHARPRGQRHHHLLDRELRRDGSAHGRLDHRGAPDDPLGPAIPADARRGQGRHPEGRRGHRGLQHPVRRRAENRPARRDRDEPARVALLGARVEGHGVPDREDRGAPRGGLPAGRDSQRHHEKDARLLRAVARLRGRQDPALDLREIPEGRPAPDHPDEVRGRGDGHRPHLRGGAGQGDPVAGDRPRRPGRRRQAAAAGTTAREALRPHVGADLPSAPRVRRRHVDRGDRGADLDRSVVSRRDCPDGRGRGGVLRQKGRRDFARAMARGQEARSLRPVSRPRPRDR